MMPSDAARPGRRRDVALDALRLTAVLLMIASHTTRLIAWDERRAWSRFSLLIEPLTASLFLILVGASLVHSWRSAQAGGRAAWYRKQAVRALGLWAISCLFYSLEDGLRLPDAITMSGILATIAYTCLLGMPLVSAPWPALWLAVTAAAGIAAHLWLDVHGVQIFALNAANSPMLPLFPFACLGGLGALALERGRALRLSVLAAAVAVLAWLLSRYAFADIFTKPLGRYDSIRQLAWSANGVTLRKEISYYNLRPILVPMIAALVTMAYAVYSFARPLLERGARVFLAMGRRSLDVYILHLTILAAFVVAGGKRPLHKTWQGDAVVLGTIAICWLWALGRDAWAARRRERRAQATAAPMPAADPA